MELDQLIETNKRLNRRCQELERLLAEKENRMNGMVKLLTHNIQMSKEFYQEMKRIRNLTHQKSHNGCWYCAFKRAIRHTFIKESRWSGNKKVTFWKFLKSDISDSYRE